MKKLLFISGLLLLSATGIAGVPERVDRDDEAPYQYYYACGQFYKADASLTVDEIIELMKEKEANCPENND